MQKELEKNDLIRNLAIEDAMKTGESLMVLDKAQTSSNKQKRRFYISINTSN